MPVQNIECQIANAQLGRYIAGEGMAAEAVRQLEAHVSNCPDCKRTLEEKRTALVATLEGTTAVSHPAPAVETPKPRPATTRLSPSASRLAQALVAKAAAEAPAPRPAPAAPAIPAEPVKPKVNTPWKPIAYSGALALVLIGMSYMSKSDILGTKASADLPEKAAVTTPNKTVAPKSVASPAPVPVATPSPAPTPTPSASPSPSPSPDEATAAIPAATPAPKSPIAKTAPAATPKVTAKPTTPAKTPVKHAVVSHPVVNQATPVHNIVRHHATARPFRVAPKHHNRIRVYDANGNPLAG